jgi:hypothetical protein
MSDAREPRSRTLTAMANDMRETFLAAGIEPSFQASRDRFGEEHRALRELLERSERRHKWRATIVTAVAISVASLLVSSFGPLFLKLIAAAK